MADQDRAEGSAPARRVLIVDGHDDDRESLRALLAGAGFDVVAAAGARDARKRLAAGAADAIVVDPDLDDGDGLALVRSLTDAGTNGRAPVVFVVASNVDQDMAERAYGSGATDFAYKPMLAEEWLARLRHALPNGDGREKGTAPHRLELNRQERSCTLDGRTHQLTRHERDFLACLLDAPNHFATYDKLIAAVWGEDRVETQYLRVLAAQVRRKLEGGRGKPPLIHTVVGEGLKLNL